MLQLTKQKAFFLFLAAAAIIVRYPFIGFESQDFIFYMGRWWNFINENGIWASFKYSFDDYPPAYLHLLSLTTLFPSDALYSVKLVSFIFELVCALSIRKIILQTGLSGEKALYLPGLFLLIPTIILNGAAWGQSDVIYSAFVICAVYLLICKRYLLSFLMLGLAFSFKLQAVFILPVFFLLCLRGAFSPLCFLMLPAVYLLSILPSVLAGRNWTDLIMLYYSQTQGLVINSNTPNIYSWLPSADRHFGIVNQTGILLTLCITATLIILIHLKKRYETLSSEDILLYSLLFTATLPFFLPQMHERYFFMAEVFAFLYCFTTGKNMWIFIVLISSSTIAYIRHLWGINLMDNSYLGILLFAVVLFLWRKALKKMPGPPYGTGHPQPKTNYHP